MNKAGIRSIVNPPSSRIARIHAAIDRIRPAVIVLGLLLLLGAFALAGGAILRDYELRVTGLWNGVTGTPRGMSTHASNEGMAELATQSILWLTGGLGVALVIPRRVEGPWFRWLGWMALLFALALFVASVLGLLGLSFHHAWSSFDPRCPLDGPCSATPRPLAPAAWRLKYLGGLALAATFVGAILSACVGVRWVLWGIVTLVRGKRSSS